jgi:hypothetical protein
LIVGVLVSCFGGLVFFLFFAWVLWVAGEPIREIKRKQRRAARAMDARDLLYQEKARLRTSISALSRERDDLQREVINLQAESARLRRDVSRLKRETGEEKPHPGVPAGGCTCVDCLTSPVARWRAKLGRCPRSGFDRSECRCPECLKQRDRGEIDWGFLMDGVPTYSYETEVVTTRRGKSGDTPRVELPDVSAVMDDVAKTLDEVSDLLSKSKKATPAQIAAAQLKAAIQEKREKEAKKKRTDDGLDLPTAIDPLWVEPPGRPSWVPQYEAGGVIYEPDRDDPGSGQW